MEGEERVVALSCEPGGQMETAHNELWRPRIYLLHIPDKASRK